MNSLRRLIRVELRDGQAGQAAVEFAAIVLPFMLLFLLILDGGLYMFTTISASNAVREGARCAVVGGGNAAVIARVDNEMPGGVTSSVTVPVRGAKVGEDVTVRADFTYGWLTPVEIFGFSDSISRTVQSTMRLETGDQSRSCP